MGYDERGAAAKHTAQGILEETICLGVNSWSRFVQDEDLEEKKKKELNNRRLSVSSIPHR